MTLTSSDWWEIYADNFGHVSTAAGGPTGGEWHVFVERSGEYEILLSRWPLEQKLALTAGREPKKMTAGILQAGKAMPIAGAKLKIAGREQSVKTAVADHVASFRVSLVGGTKTQLHGWFQDAKGADLCGVFYASVKWLRA